MKKKVPNKKKSRTETKSRERKKSRERRKKVANEEKSREQRKKVANKKKSMSLSGHRTFISFVLLQGVRALILIPADFSLTCAVVR